MIDIILFMGFVYAVMVAVFSASVAGSIASSRRRSSIAWFLAGLLFGPIALAVYLLPENPDPRQRLPISEPDESQVSPDFTPPPSSDPSSPWAKYR